MIKELTAIDAAQYCIEKGLSYGLKAVRSAEREAKQYGYSAVYDLSIQAVAVAVKNPTSPVRFFIDSA